MEWTVKAVRCNIPDRYVLIDKETGEIVDDCQGYGFRTEKKAYACWAYKNRDKKLEKKIIRWLKNHKEIIIELDKLALDMYEHGEDFLVEDFRQFFARRNMWINYPIKDMYYVWKRGDFL